ncbi:MAG: hypothetical protein SO062_02105, partial [Sodaliphilus sp.]|nr:hypothetical protein [Sodaliphilus sp.]
WACSPSGAYGQAIASESNVLDTNTSFYPKAMFCFRSKLLYKTIITFLVFTHHFSRIIFAKSSLKEY